MEEEFDDNVTISDHNPYDSHTQLTEICILLYFMIKNEAIKHNDCSLIEYSRNQVHTTIAEIVLVMLLHSV